MSEVENTETKVEVKNFPETALGVYRDMDLGEWVVVEIPYHPRTGEVGEFKRQAMGRHKDMAIEKFKIRAVELEVVT